MEDFLWLRLPNTGVGLRAGSPACKGNRMYWSGLMSFLLYTLSPLGCQFERHDWSNPGYE